MKRRDIIKGMVAMPLLGLIKDLSFSNMGMTIEGYGPPRARGRRGRAGVTG